MKRTYRVRCKDEVEAQRRRWTFYETIRLDKDRRFNIFYFSVAGSSVEDMLQGQKGEETALEKSIRR
jgi:hypothetical protein